MRKDMNKVIDEAYRYGRSLVLKPGRPQRDVENQATREGIRRPYQSGWGRCMKESSDHTTPLRRFLDKQVGRKWDAVFSEICRTYDARNPVNRRILELVARFVTSRGLSAQNGQVVEFSSYGAPSEPRGLFVHPQSGLLCKSIGPSYMDHYRKAEAERQKKVDARSKVVSKSKKLVKVQDVWFIVEFAVVTPPREMAVGYTDVAGGKRLLKLIDTESICRDVLTGEAFRETLEGYYTKIGLEYAKSKRQASHKELKQFGAI